MSLHPPINSHLSFPHPPSTPSSSSSRRLSQSPGVKLKYGTTRPLLGIMSSVQRRASSAILKSHQDETKSVHRRNLSTASAGTKRPLGHARVVSISDKSTFISHHRERFPHLHEVHDSAIKDDFISSHAENFPYLHGKAAENAEGDLTEKLKQEREAGKVKRQSLRLDNAKDGQLQGQEWEDGIKPKLRPLSLRLPVKSISVPSSPLLSNPASEPGVLDGGRAATEDAVSNSKPETQPTLQVRTSQTPSPPPTPAADTSLQNSTYSWASECSISTNELRVASHLLPSPEIMDSPISEAVMTPHQTGAEFQHQRILAIARTTRNLHGHGSRPTMDMKEESDLVEYLTTQYPLPGMDVDSTKAMFDPIRRGVKRDEGDDSPELTEDIYGTSTKPSPEVPVDVKRGFSQTSASVRCSFASSLHDLVADGALDVGQKLMAEKAWMRRTSYSSSMNGKRSSLAFGYDRPSRDGHSVIGSEVDSLDEREEFYGAGMSRPLRRIDQNLPLQMDREAFIAPPDFGPPSLAMSNGGAPWPSLHGGNGDLGALGFPHAHQDARSAGPEDFHDGSSDNHLPTSSATPNALIREPTTSVGFDPENPFYLDSTNENPPVLQYTSAQRKQSMLPSPMPHITNHESDLTQYDLHDLCLAPPPLISHSQRESPVISEGGAEEAYDGIVSVSSHSQSNTPPILWTTSSHERTSHLRNRRSHHRETEAGWTGSEASSPPSMSESTSRPCFGHSTSRISIDHPPYAVLECLPVRSSSLVHRQTALVCDVDPGCAVNGVIETFDTAVILSGSIKGQQELNDESNRSPIVPRNKLEVIPAKRRHVVLPPIHQLMFGLGFICPPLWFIGAFLPPDAIYGQHHHAGSRGPQFSPSRMNMEDEISAGCAGGLCVMPHWNHDGQLMVCWRKCTIWYRPEDVWTQRCRIAATVVVPFLLLVGPLGEVLRREEIRRAKRKGAAPAQQ